VPRKAGGLPRLLAGYGTRCHSRHVVRELAEAEICTYISEPGRGRQHWAGRQLEKRAVYANRRRARDERGSRLQRQRGEKLERVNAHLYETDGMRRVHLRGHNNILKRLLIHVGALNLGLLMRTIWGVGTPRGLQGGSAALILATDLFFFALVCGRYSKKHQAVARQRYVSERDNCRSIRSDAARTSPPLRRIASFPTQAASGHSKPSEFISC